MAALGSGSPLASISAQEALDFGVLASVSVPATSANLGPGFDACGLALEFRDELTARVFPARTGPADAGDGDALPPFAAKVAVTGEGAESLPSDASHFIADLIRRTWKKLGISGEGIILEMTAQNRIPHARGMGSSAAAIVAAVVLAIGLLSAETKARLAEAGTPADEQWIFQQASAFEGHPDNVAPALFGGLTVSWTESGDGQDRYFTTVLECTEALTPVVGIPADPVSTELARGLLPQELAYADAVFSVARATLLPLALSDRPELVFAATEDRLHQDFRQPAMPVSHAAMKALREQRIASAISGAGPSVMALCAPGQEAQAQAVLTEAGMRVETLSFAGQGAKLNLNPAEPA